MKVVIQRKLLPNPKHVLVSDLRKFLFFSLILNLKLFTISDNTGTKDLIVAYSDRKIHIYRWDSPSSLSSINSNNGPIPNTMSNNYISDAGKFILQQSWELENQVSFCLNGRNY